MEAGRVLQPRSLGHRQQAKPPGPSACPTDTATFKSHPHPNRNSVTKGSEVINTAGAQGKVSERATSLAKACVPAQCNGAWQLGFLRWRLSKEPGRREATVPTHGSTPHVPSSPNANNSHPLLLHHTHCKHIVLLQRGKPDSGHGKR